MILVYNDEGVGELGLCCLLYKLKSFGKLFHIVDADFIKNNDLSEARILIIGGGADIPYCKRLGSVGIQNIQRFVSSGGAYIGICAGAYFACSEIEFIGADYNVFDTRELALFGGRAIGSISELIGGSYYDGTSFSKAIVDINCDSYRQEVYYHGGCYFDGVSESQIFATYDKIDKPAIITDNYGNGKYFLSGVHFETEYWPYKKYIEANIDNTKFTSDIEEQIVDKLNRISENRVWDYILEHII